jgi:hypothetical protein
MAGSLTWRQYTTDAGVSYSIRIDESNANAALVGGTAGAIMSIRTANLPLIPVGIKKRYVNAYNSALPAQKRKFYIGSAAVASTLVSGSTLSAEAYPGTVDTAGTAVTWIITSYRGEKSRFAPAFSAADTGLTDGTVSQ